MILYHFFSIVMQKQKNSQGKPIYRMWPLPLLDILCNYKTADIFPHPTLGFNKRSISKTMKILLDIARRLELTNNVVKSKMILLKKNLLTIRNAGRAIYWREDKLLSLLKFHWLGPIAGLFYF